MQYLLSWVTFKCTCSHSLAYSEHLLSTFEKLGFWTFTMCFISHLRIRKLIMDKKGTLFKSRWSVLYIAWEVISKMQCSNLISSYAETTCNANVIHSAYNNKCCTLPVQCHMPWLPWLLVCKHCPLCFTYFSCLCKLAISPFSYTWHDVHVHCADQEPISTAKQRQGASNSRCNSSVGSPTAVYGQWQRCQSSRLGHPCSQLLDAPWRCFAVLMGSWARLYLVVITVDLWENYGDGLCWFWENLV